MTEADIYDVRCLPYMPLHIERLRKSRSWLRCKRRPELGYYLMNLWMRAWHELPAGSVPDDDDILADAAGCDPLEWEKIKADVLSGWELIGDRFYHPVVVELAAEAAQKITAARMRTQAAREARGKKTKEIQAAPSVTENVTETVTSPEGKGREEKYPPYPPCDPEPMVADAVAPAESVSPPACHAEPTEKPGRLTKAETDAAFARFRKAYPPRKGGQDWPKAGDVFARVVARGVDPDIIVAAAEQFYRIEEGLGHLNTPYVKQARTWMNGRCWEEYAAPPVTNAGRPDGWPARLPDPETCFSAWRRGSWPPTWGFPPGDPDCPLPPAIVSDWQRRRDQAA